MTADLHHLAAAYALDALDAEECTAFEQHLADCDDCRRDVDDFTATASRLADVDAVAPPEALKSRVMDAVAATEQVPPIAAPVERRPDTAGAATSDGSVVHLDTRRRRRIGAWLAAAAAVVVIAVGAIVVSGTRGGDDVDDLLAASDAVVTTLAGETGTLRVVWSDERDQVAVVGSGLPRSGEGLVYALWAIESAGPRPAGLFEPDDGSVRFVADIAEVDPGAWGVTIEPDGGSPAPTTDILFFGETV
jgi:anti-sigma-K factor RskA